ncbi:MAG: hypothetical protein FWC47_16235 [Oscillospiraceae bacterium]|nr:hypothetical protein [Oscillospiraceae bacterium]
MRIRKGKITLITALTISLVLLLNVVCFATTITNPAIDPVATSDSITVVDATFDPTVIDPTSFDTYYPSSITPLPGGGESVNFIINGVTNSYPIPPNNFNPKKATNEQLAEYGLPLRPSDPNLQKDWENQLKNFKKAVKPSKAYVKKNSTASPYSTQTGSNWAGIVNCTNTSYLSGGATDKTGLFQYVTGTFIQPVISNVSSIKQACIWVGIGGCVEYQPLLQCGTMANANPVYPGTYYAFYENISSIEPNLAVAMSVSVNAGNSISASVIYDPNTYVTNFRVSSNGIYSLAKVDYSINFYYGGTAEWIVERPKYNGMPTDLADFTQVNWSGCYTYTNITNVGSTAGVSYPMGNNVMAVYTMTNASPINVTATTFSLKHN